MSQIVVREFAELVGHTLASIEGEKGGDELVLSLETGQQYRLYHQQDCCEGVQIEDIEGDLHDLVGAPLTMAEEVSHEDPGASESGTWTFYKFATAKGYVTIRWYGESNGYYAEDVTFEALESGR